MFDLITFYWNRLGGNRVIELGSNLTCYLIKLYLVVQIYTQISQSVDAYSSLCRFAYGRFE